ncbi:uncharacterized protein LOC111636847 [Centruroides sculpturatus]|uniref:uncharacterized protein LOC111636847 n=1 Tax=Centruroides sculpturatus TaxID=218467 RepID=UPI000C6CC979|nr:uncharacterized protein LOC111636847 [Centruroides sculpturatus]XP_023238003.1 uncharacterized protein LOC111636847 [Centruroides sculpturatus]XP_023238004.1 uncharacterized protein LOC111636847 [Centruroides sculpturatus]XP_023238005.1 uncharacterized protein LOC111636847 [Centruroides sculpturatus]
MWKPAGIFLLLLLVRVSQTGLSARLARQVPPSDEKNEIPGPRTDRTDPPEEFPDDDDGEDELSFRFFVDPFRHFDAVFQQFEDAMKRIYSLFNQTASLPDDFRNTSSEIIEVNGRKYNVSRSVLEKTDNRSQILVHSVSVFPSDRKKRNV